MDGRRVVLIDWGLATQGHPVVELCWYLVHCARRIDATRDQIVEDFGAHAATPRTGRPRRRAAVRARPVRLDLGHSAVVNPDPAERAWAREELAWWGERRRAPLPVASRLR